MHRAWLRERQGAGEDGVGTDGALERQLGTEVRGCVHQAPVWKETFACLEMQSTSGGKLTLVSHVAGNGCDCNGVSSREHCKIRSR